MFRKEQYLRHQPLYEQGKPADKVFIIYEGEFEVTRKKHNKLTKKEIAIKTIRVLNNSRKPDHDPNKSVKPEL